MDKTDRAELDRIIDRWLHRDWPGNDLGKVRQQEAEKCAEDIRQFVRSRVPPTEEKKA